MSEWKTEYVPEIEAWDRFAAAAIGPALAISGVVPSEGFDKKEIKLATELASEIADAMLEERRSRLSPKR